MKITDFELPIVTQWRATFAYPFEVLSDSFLRQWKATSKTLPGHTQRDASFVLRMLECLVQITKQTPPESISASTFGAWDRLFKQLFGAIWSQHFYLPGDRSRQRLSTLLQKMRNALAADLGAHVTWEIQVPQHPTPQTQQLSELFEAMELDADRVLMWRGWPCKQKSRRVSYAPLLPIYTRLGPEFTKKLYNISATYLSGRQLSQLHAVIALSRYIEQSNHPISVELLKDGEQTSEFFFQLYEHYLRTSYNDGKGIPIASVVNRWRGDITNFFHEYVFPTGLIAKPAGAFPTPRGISNTWEPTNIRVDENGEFHDKLLTAIPLEITDDQAMELIFVQIKADLDAAKEWAWSEVSRMSQLLERRTRLAKEGSVREIVRGQQSVQHRTDWKHPNHLANGAATFEYHGYPCAMNSRHIGQLFPSPRNRWAVELAIPVTGALVPHCAILVSEHPQITTSFLEEFELYDKNGKLRGLIATDSGEIVSGVEFR